MSIPSPYHWSATLRGSTSGQTSNSLLSSFSQRSIVRGGRPREHTFLGLLEITPTREPQARLCGLAHQDCLLRAVKTGPGNQGSVVIMLLVCWGFLESFLKYAFTQKKAQNKKHADSEVNTHVTSTQRKKTLPTPWKPLGPPPHQK